MACFAKRRLRAILHGTGGGRRQLVSRTSSSAEKGRRTRLCLRATAGLSVGLASIHLCCWTDTGSPLGKAVGFGAQPALAFGKREVFAEAPVAPRRLSSSGTRLPQPEHATVMMNEINDKLIIVGDIHGCLEETKELLQKVNYDRSKMTLISVGDLVNKGPYSPEVISFFRQEGAFAVRGNHDDSCIQAARGVGKYKDSYPEKYNYVQKFSSEDLDWYENIPLTLCLPELDPPIVIVHAGLLPGVKLPDQLFKNLLKVRRVKRTNAGIMNYFLGFLGFKQQSEYTGYEKQEPSATLWAREFSNPVNGPQTAVMPGSEKPVHVFFGHDARTGLQREAHATGLDTGCCYGRQLTGALISIDREHRKWTSELVSVNAFEEHTIGNDKKKKKSK